jgi:hypothetical protein
MLRSTPTDSRQSNLRTDLTTTAGTIRAATTPGDFARGQRRHLGRGPVNGDFATGIRTTSTPRVTGDFAIGTHTSPRPTAVGDFATGTRIVSPPVITTDRTTADTALPIAA